MTLLRLRDLRVRFRARGAEVEAVRGVSLDVHPGETLALVGESGSGKSQAMMAVMGLLAPNGRAEGSARFRGEELIGLSPRALNRHRGAGLAMIFQEPMTALDPLFTVGHQLGLALRLRAGLRRGAARARALELLDEVGIPEPARRLASYPHELSGGQRQRVMIALALATDPALLIADEPTTALDATVQAQVLDLLASLRRRRGLALVLVTHDLGLVRAYADRTCVMQAGRIVEEGPKAALFAHPAHPYTRALLAAEPHGAPAPTPDGAPVLLEAEGVAVTYPGRRGLFRAGAPHRAVEGVSLALRAGETLGVVGESGSGKSTLGRALLRLQPSFGTIRFEGQELGQLDAAALRPLRRHMQIVFQDPFGSLSPRLRAGEIVAEGLAVHEPGLSRGERDRRAAAAFEEVGLDPAWRGRYPHEFSGGQRQRLAIARAMILGPRLVVLDEPTSALDRGVQARIVALLLDLQRRRGLAYLFISHDLAVVRALSHRVMVMRAGRVVEAGAAADIFERPADPYTRALLAAARLG